MSEDVEARIRKKGINVYVKGLEARIDVVPLDDVLAVLDGFVCVVEKTLQDDIVAFKEVLKQEIEYFRNSGEFDDVEHYQKRLREIMDYVQYFFDRKLLGVEKQEKPQK